MKKAALVVGSECDEQSARFPAENCKHPPSHHHHHHHSHYHHHSRDHHFNDYHIHVQIGHYYHDHYDISDYDHTTIITTILEIYCRELKKMPLLILCIFDIINDHHDLSLIS